MKRIRTISLAGALVVLLAGAYLSTAGHTAPGQPALVEMNSQALSALQAEFNRAADSLRVILLLSPT